MTDLYQYPDVVLANDANRAYIVAEQLYRLRQKPTIISTPNRRRDYIKEAISTRGARDISFLSGRTQTPFGKAWGRENGYDFGPNGFTNSSIIFFEDKRHLESLPRKFNSLISERIEFSDELKQSLERLEDRIGKPRSWWNLGRDRTAHICVQDEVCEISTGIRNQLGDERIIGPYKSSKVA